MFTPPLYSVLVTLLAAALLFVTIALVGRARGRYKVNAPHTDGPEEFQRTLRAQINTVEQLVLFLPVLWCFALTVSDMWAAALGGVWLVGRSLYVAGYIKAAPKRGLGFIIALVASSALFIGGLYGVINLLWLS
jgi:glutathione S-transferase